MATRFKGGKVFYLNDNADTYCDAAIWKARKRHQGYCYRSCDKVQEMISDDSICSRKTKA